MAFSDLLSISRQAWIARKIFREKFTHTALRIIYFVGL